MITCQNSNISNRIYVRNNLFCVCVFIFSFLSFNGLGLNPAYLFIATLIFFTFLIILSRCVISNVSLVIISFACLISISQLIAIYYSSAFLNGLSKSVNYISWIIFSFSILYSVSYYEIFKGLSRVNRFFVFKRILFFFVLFLVVELMTRIIIGDISSGFLYGFKKSLFYFDSNFVGLVVLSFLMLVIYYRNINFPISKVIVLFLFLLLFFTMSRAAIIASVISLLVFFKHEGFKSRALFVLFIYILVFTSLSYFYFSNSNLLSNVDGSFNSKFYIVKQAFLLYSELSMQSLLFGVGLGNFDKYTDIFAHSIFVTMIIEMGVVGTFLFITFIIYSIHKSNGLSLYIWLPTFICGLSLFGVYSPFLFVINAVFILEGQSSGD
ncbi:O-antigen ligase family protein [Shewanella xiamenensis]|uniref:O-antigen ligase family protein n=1 Tax=Shewanella xiamenensis TaxID=332186 RepID=UPI00244AACC6|nr:O-antigen ligase family protein [Shewanella xiamenensis]MDH1314312.1 O-antigen ligase family protein [Shewanella xiamenensis]